MKNTQDWNNHLKRVYESHPNLTLKQAMSEASKTYNSKNQNKKYNGEGIYQSAINSINRLTGSNARIEDGEYHLPHSLFTGPGTRISDKLNVQPANATDACSKAHDIAYNEAMKLKDPKEMARRIRFADNEVKDCYKVSINEDPFLGRAAYTGIAFKNALEDAVPSIAKKYEKQYYGSVNGSSLMQGNAKKIIHKSLYK